MTKNKNPILEQKINLDIEIFGAFDFNTLQSWSQIVLWCAINGISVNYDLFKFFLYGAILYNQVFEMLHRTIKTTDFLDAYISNAETLEIIYKFTDIEYLSSKTTDLMNKWLDIMKSFSDTEIIYTAFANTSMTNARELRYKLFSIIDTKYPLLLYKFYNKHKEALQQFDQNFVAFLKSRTLVKVKYNFQFKTFYDIICNDCKDQQNSNVFLN